MPDGVGPFVVSGDLWIFGYGSLVWRPAFPHLERRSAYVRGWSRRFYQGSTDHRGVPGAPGRVVTLLPDPDGRCWGTAYRVADHEVEGVLARLDHREKGGYERHLASIHDPDSHVTIGEAMLYVATEDNPEWLGPAPLTDIAHQVRRSRGPSGDNVEYVVNLARALREMGAHDPHVFGLARHLQ